MERDETLVQQWLKDDYPKIKALAQRKKAEIYFGDAAHIRSDHHAGRTWGRRGERPVVQATGARYGMSLISAVTARGHMRFMIKEKGGVNADVFIEFLKRLMVGATHPIFLIVDRGPAHRAKKIKAFVETLGGKLRLFFLPLYSQDRNGVETSEGGYGRTQRHSELRRLLLATQHQENPLILRKRHAQIRRINVDILMN